MIYIAYEYENINIQIKNMNYDILANYRRFKCICFFYIINIFGREDDETIVFTNYFHKVK